MLLDEILNDERFLALIGEPAKLATDLEQAHYFADVVSLVMIVAILFRDDEGEGLIDALNTDSEVQERHVEVEELLQTLVHAVVEVERVDQRKNLGRPSVPVHPIRLLLVLL